MKLIVGLGNIGKEYEKTRHNVGFMILDEYLNNKKWSSNKYGFFYKEKNIIFLKPSTFMNLSGNAVQYFMKYFKIDLKNLLIIHDDMDLNIGSLRLKTKSASGGHNGINSIINMLGTNDFLRLKIGISKPDNFQTTDYVLGKFTKKEMEILEENNKKIKSIIDGFVSDLTAEVLMNKYNG